MSALRFEHGDSMECPPCCRKIDEWVHVIDDAFRVSFCGACGRVVARMYKPGAGTVVMQGDVIARGAFVGDSREAGRVFASTYRHMIEGALWASDSRIVDQDPGDQDAATPLHREATLEVTPVPFNPTEHGVLPKKEKP